MRKPYVTSHHSVMPDGNAPEDRRIGINRDVVLEDGMAGDVDRPSGGIVPEIPGAQSDALVNRDMLSDYGSLSDYHSGPMVYGEPSAYLRGRMDIDAG